tara:strand:+ start:1959 stop:2357 length:399 start_codon:yes stop_codon:yes gene_type:complete
MSTAFLIWAYLSLGSLVSATVVILVLFGVAYGLAFAMMGYETDFGDEERGSHYKNELRQYNKLKAMFPTVLKTFMVVIFVAALYPSKDDLKYIIGGTAVVAAVNVEGFSELPENVVEAANSFLEDITEKGGE